MPHPIPISSNDLLHRIFDTLGSDRTPLSADTSAERARIRRVRVQRMLVRSLYAGSGR